MDKLALNGLTAADYMHPDEKFFADKSPANIFVFRKGFDLVSDLSVKFLRQVTEGKWVELNRSTAPEVFDVAQEAASILNCPTLPRMFVRRVRQLKIIVGGTDCSQMLIPEFILEEFDRQMQLFAFGNALSMFKCGHVQLATISSVLCEGMMSAVAALTVQAYLRAADLSSDRGGLLCCQDFTAAARVILTETGLPLSELRYLDATETLRLVENYLDEAESGSFDMLTENAKLFRRTTNDTSPLAFRLRELLTWYRDGYETVLARRCVR